MPVSYELNSNGVYGIRNGVYQDTLQQLIDDFEDGDISEYGSDTGQYATQTSTVKEGTTALQGDVSSGNAYHILSTSGLNYYPSQGDTWRLWNRVQSSGDMAANHFGVQSVPTSGLPDNGYMVQTRVAANEIRIYLRSSASWTLLASASVSLSSATWYEIKVDWATDGTITLTIFDSAGSQLAQASATDTSFSSGGIGWGAHNANSNASSIFFDHSRTI